jgi:WD40 repeat protein
VGHQSAGLAVWTADGTVVWQDRKLRGYAVDFAEDGRQLYLAQFRGISTVDTETGQELTKTAFDSALPGTASVRVSAREQTILMPQYNGTQIIDFGVSPAVLRSVTGPPASSLTDDLKISASGQLAVSKKSQTVSIWETRTGKILDTLKHDRRHVSEIAISADGRRVAVTAGQVIQIWEFTEP